MSGDKYLNFEALSKREKEGVDYKICERSGDSPVAIIAPHGGNIEQHTSEIADAMAGDDFSYYSFEGIKTKNNRSLHITSHHFDEPRCLALVGKADIVVAIHGWGDDGKKAAVGGRDTKLRNAVHQSLTLAKFDAVIVKAGDLAAIRQDNICNRGHSKKGVQIEIMMGLRKSLKGERLKNFSDAIRKAIADSR